MRSRVSLLWRMNSVTTNRASADWLVREAGRVGLQCRRRADVQRQSAGDDPVELAVGLLQGDLQGERVDHLHRGDALYDGEVGGLIGGVADPLPVELHRLGVVRRAVAELDVRLDLQRPDSGVVALERLRGLRDDLTGLGVLPDERVEHGELLPTGATGCGRELLCAGSNERTSIVCM